MSRPTDDELEDREIAWISMRGTLSTGGTALAAAFLGFCCNPLHLVSVFAVCGGLYTLQRLWSMPPEFRRQIKGHEFLPAVGLGIGAMVVGVISFVFPFLVAALG